MGDPRKFLGGWSRMFQEHLRRVGGFVPSSHWGAPVHVTVLASSGSFLSLTSVGVGIATALLLPTPGHERSLPCPRLCHSCFAEPASDYPNVNPSSVSFWNPDCHTCSRHMKHGYVTISSSSFLLLMFLIISYCFKLRCRESSRLSSRSNHLHNATRGRGTVEWYTGHLHNFTNQRHPSKFNKKINKNTFSWESEIGNAAEDYLKSLQVSQ